MYKTNLLSKTFLLLAMAVAGVTGAWAETVTYTISSTNTLTTSGTAPAGSSATIAETYSTSTQMTSGNSQILTLKGFAENKVTNITLSMKSNSKGGAGKLSYSTDGGTTYTYIVGSASQGVAFNQSAWNGSWSTSYVNISKDVNFTCGTADVKVKIEATANSLYCQSYTVTYESLLSYTITALSSNNSYGTVSVSGKTITATPSEGYRVSLSNPYTVTDGTATVSQNGNVFTVEAQSNCTVQINFEAIPQHNVTFSVNGEESTPTSYLEGACITFPNDPESINGKSFVGWTTAPITGTITSEPEIVTEATMSTDDIIFYAVFANSTTVIANVTNTYGFETEESGDWDVDGPFLSDENANTGRKSGKINTANTYVTFKNKVSVTEFSFAFARKTDNNNYNVYIETSSDNETWTAVETYAMSSFSSNGTFTTKSHTFNGENELYVRFHCYNTTAQRYVDDVTIKYNQEQQGYTDYCTTVTLPTATININSDCTDGDYCYGTYSNTQAFVVSDDLIVYEVKVVNDGIQKTAYQTGAVVPANTGVLVAAFEGGDYTVTLSSETGTSVLDEDNMLRATGAEGITAEAMATNDKSCEFFRLTMHNGTQVGFYWGAEDGGAFAVGANKAYLAVPKATVEEGVRGFSLFDSSTAIRGAVSEFDKQDSLQTFNLQGQRVAAGMKGIVIKNGKKYINK